MSNDELLLYILIKRQHTLVVPMPEIQRLAELSGYTSQQLFDLFHQMIEKKLVKITQAQVNQQPVDAYDFSLLYEKLAALPSSSASDQIDAQTQEGATTSSPQQITEQDRQAVFESIEREFGRTLSSLEMESISQWLDLDHYQPKIIELALKEAVLSQVYNLKYMDRILRSWEKLHLTTPQQISEYTRKRNLGAVKPEETAFKGPEIPFIKISDPKPDEKD